MQDRKTKGYQEYDIVAQISKKADLRVVGKQIQQLRDGKGDIGNGTKGKIDFLVKWCGYTHFYVNNFR